LKFILLLHNLEFEVDAQRVVTGITISSFEHFYNFTHIDMHMLKVMLAIINKDHDILLNTKLPVVQGIRDTMARQYYYALWIKLMTQINDVLAPSESSAKDSFLGILDIFGFENFIDSSGKPANKLTQLCINYTNEVIANMYNQNIFQAEKDAYQTHGIDECQAIKDLKPPSTCVRFVRSLLAGIHVYGMRMKNQPAVMADYVEQGRIFEDMNHCHVAMATTGENIGADENLQWYQEDLNNPLKVLDQNNEWTIKAKCRSLVKDIRGAVDKDTIGSGCIFRVKHYAGLVEYQTDEMLSHEYNDVVADFHVLMGSYTDVTQLMTSLGSIANTRAHPLFGNGYWSSTVPAMRVHQIRYVFRGGISWLGLGKKESGWGWGWG
jgi:hypothetical protein